MFRPGKDVPLNNLNIQTWDNIAFRSPNPFTMRMTFLYFSLNLGDPPVAWSQHGPSCYGEVDVQLAAIGSMGPFPAEVLPAAHRSDSLHCLR